MARLALLLAVLAIACKREAPAREAPGSEAVTTRAAVTDPCTKAKVEGAMAWIADDYPAALACAKARNLPLVLDLWAPWCHTCLSMQTTVFTDPSFHEETPRFVYAALDTDRDVNAAVVAKFPPSAWPTFYVVGPDEAVLARFVGSASVAQFHAFLDSGARALAGGAAGADARLLGAERATALKDYKTADEELTAAIGAAPPDWVRLPDALTSLITTKQREGDLAGCLDVAEKYLDHTGNAAAASDFLVTAMDCAKQQEKSSADRVLALRGKALARWQALLADPKAPLSVDDRSDALDAMRKTLDELAKKDEAKATAELQLKLLEDAAAKAPDPTAASTYNWQRAEVSVYLGRPLDAVPALTKSAAALPTEYDPPARLGWVYLKAGKLDEARAWTDKALAMAYGPRKARLLNQRAEIAQRQHDKAAERKARTELVALWSAMPAGQANPEALKKAKEQLADLEKPQAATDDGGSGSGSAH